MKLRITLLIVLTLLLGFAIGMLTSAKLRHKRMNPVRIYASEQYFRDHLYKIVEPDSIQKEELNAIIVRYGRELNELNAIFRKDIEELMDKQWKEIKPVLNRDQIDELEEFDRNRREMMKKFKRRSSSDERSHFDRGPGRGRRPPGFNDSIPNPPGRKTDSL
ncbi:MAG: hypothetical protein KFF49_09540 [Bacteroidales bacterium]|nr:hypothetical protein [Bacteroidales bacterium]